MKRMLYFVLCIFTCMALLTGCKDDSEPTDDLNVESVSPADADDSAEEEKAPDTDDAQEENSEAPSEVVIGDASSLPDEDTEDASDSEGEDDNGLTDAQENVAENPDKQFQASGTFNGFVDSSSIEVTMSDGTYQTFFVYEDSVVNHLMSLSEGTTIQFLYTSRDGQINPEIVAIN